MLTPDEQAAMAAKFDDHRRTLVVNPADYATVAAGMARFPFGVLTPRVQVSDIVDPGHSMLMPSKAYLRDLLAPRQVERVLSPKLPFPTREFDPLRVLRAPASN